ncbi:MAG: type III secretion T3S chaperone [Chlamydia sp.]
MSITPPKYPLKEVLEVKKRRVDEAEKNVKEKQKLLIAEEEKLKQKEKERDKVLEHYKAKLTQLRNEFDNGTTSAKIDQIKLYLKVVQEKLAVEEKKVKEQQQQVELAQKNVEIAKNQLKDRQREQEKIDLHKIEWSKEMKKELEIEEARFEDDLGSTMFLSKMVRDKKNKNL